MVRQSWAGFVMRFSTVLASIFISSGCNSKMHDIASGGLNRRHTFPMSQEIGKSSVKVLGDAAPDKDLLLFFFLTSSYVCLSVEV